MAQNVKKGSQKLQIPMHLSVLSKHKWIVVILPWQINFKLDVFQPNNHRFYPGFSHLGPVWDMWGYVTTLTSLWDAPMVTSFYFFTFFRSRSILKIELSRSLRQREKYWVKFSFAAPSNYSWGWFLVQGMVYFYINLIWSLSTVRPNLKWSKAPYRTLCYDPDWNDWFFHYSMKIER